MTSKSELIDRRVIALKRKRRQHQKSSLFKLYEQAAEDVKQRLFDAKANPKKIAIVSGFPDVWQELFPTAELISDTENLNFSTSNYDLIVHGLCLQLSNDPLGQIIQCRRACKPEGLFIAVSFGARTLQELRTALIHSEIAIKGGSSPRVIPMGDLMDLGNLTVRSNLTHLVSDRLEVKLSFKSLFEIMHHLRNMGDTNCLSARQSQFTPKILFTRANQYYMKHFTCPDGNVFATFELIFITGWAPTK